MGATSAYTGRKYEGDETLARLINSFAAGFAIGAPIGGVANLKKTTEADLLQGTPPEDTDASPAEPGMPEGSTQQELFPEDTDLGTAPTQPVEPTQGELFPDQNLGVGNVDQLELFDQPVIPSRQPGFQMELPFGQQQLMAQPQPVQQEMELVAPVGAPHEGRHGGVLQVHTNTSTTHILNRQSLRRGHTRPTPPPRLR